MGHAHLRLLRSAFAAHLLCLMNNACCLPLGIYSTLRGLMRGGHGGGRRFLCRLRRSSYGIIGDFPTDNAGQTTLQKAGRSGCGGACAAGGSVGKVPDNFSSHAGSEGDTLECHHRLTQHGTAGMPHVDADACHEAVDFLRDFEKTNRAENPDQDISRHGLAAGTADCGFDIAFLQSKRRYRQGERKQKNGAQQRNDSMIFLRGNDLLHGKRI